MATGMIEQLKKQLILKRFTFGYGGSIAAGAGKRLLPSDVGYSIPAGYHPVGITCFVTGNANLVLDYLQPQYNSDQTANYFVAVKNVHASSSASSNSAIAEILFAPEWMVQIIDSDESAKPTGDIMREPVFKIKNFTSDQYSISSGGGKAFTRSDFDFFVPEGYEIFSLRNFSSGGYRVSISDADPFSPSRMLTVRNTYSSAVNNITAELGVVFINRKFMLPDTRKGLIIRHNMPTLFDKSDDYYEIAGPYPNFIRVDPIDQFLPSDYPFLVDNELLFYLFHYNSLDGSYHKYYPKKVEIISGWDYINFLDSTCYKFKIPEDFTDRQIILNFTFD